MRPRLFALPIIICVATSTCDHAPTPPSQRPRRLASLVIVSGDGQKAEVGTVLPQPVVIRLRDSLGAPIRGHVIHYGYGRVIEDSVLTDSLGLASAHWVLGGTAGTQRLTVQAFTLPSSPYNAYVAFTATGIPGPPGLIRANVSDTAVVLPGTELDTAGVVVTDRFGNALAAEAVTWTVLAGGGSVVPLSTTTDAKGSARAIWTMGPSPVENRLAVTAGDASATLVASTTGPFSAVALYAGDYHTCALTVLGVAYCWGSNRDGQVGANTGYDLRPQTSPIKLSSNVSFVSITAGASHTCGLTATAQAYCWGAGDLGQLGNGGRLPSPLPARVSGGLVFSALAAGGNHTCGLASGAIYCWGSNLVGQLGDGTVVDRTAPTLVRTTVSFSKVVAGTSFTCGLTVVGEALCWGGDGSGELGVDVSASCLISDDYYGGPVRIPCSSTPVSVGKQFAFTTLTGGKSGSCGVTIDARVLCWGNALIGPRFIAAAPSETIAIGYDACLLDAAGRVSCWSFDNSSGAFLPLDTGLTFASLTAGAAHFCGVSRDATGVVYCWGDNRLGQLGDGTTRARAGPVAVVAPLNR